MNKGTASYNTPENREMLLKIKENLREEVLQGVKSVGVQRRLFSEYYDLAGATGALLAMLQDSRFSDSLSDAAREQYDKIMTRLSCCGLRTQILLEQSTAEEFTALLRQSQPETVLPN